MFDREAACQLISQLVVGRDSATRVELPPPALIKPRTLWTGKQIFSLILKPSRECDVRINLCAKNKKYTKSTSHTYRQTYIYLLKCSNSKYFT